MSKKNKCCKTKRTECITIVCPDFTCGCGVPSDDENPPLGTIKANVNNGDLFVFTSSGWKQLATV